LSLSKPPLVILHEFGPFTGILIFFYDTMFWIVLANAGANFVRALPIASVAYLLDSEDGRVRTWTLE
jgi:hypothetical protein